LLSRALVAFTIELDNTWESRVPHRTTRFGGPRGGVYATSLAMWSNFMRAIPEEGVPVAELERRVRARLSYSANVLRILDEDGVQIARLARRSGVAPESLRVAVGILAKRRFIAVGADPGGGRLKLARLLGPGLAGQALYDARPAEIEADWCRRVGDAPVRRLRASLERLVTAPEGGRAPVCEGLEPPAGTWRSRVPAAEVLPDFPMPRQSGHPDGA
jgi:hypothetical protein